MRFQSYFNTAINIIHAYDGTIPLHHFLKQYFSQHKKHGSKDRKFITQLCYNFYRLGKSFHQTSTQEKLKIAIFLCNDKIDEWKILFDEEWINNHSNLLQQRIAFIQTKYNSFSLNDIFPFADEVSEAIDSSTFIQSFFIQPDVFIRIRPGHFNNVLNRYKEQKITFNIIEENCIALPALININSIIKIDEEAVVQDYSSQKIKEFLFIIKQEMGNSKQQISVWDCCAGSGGKSILAHDVFEKINLTVTDVRSSIIENLKQRFANAGIKNYKSFVVDIAINVSKALPLRSGKGFDLIICDAPCTGSGTWSRTPEQVYFFQPQKIDDYALLQQKIISNTIPLLKNGGWFLYITCSAFKKENEAIVEFIKQHQPAGETGFHLKLIKMELLKGYSLKADTMFAALFKKN